MFKLSLPEIVYLNNKYAEFKCDSLGRLVALTYFWMQMIDRGEAAISEKSN